MTPRKPAAGPGRAGLALIVLVALVPMARVGVEARPPSASPPLRFNRELVRLNVERDTLEVEGLYEMLCTPGSAPATVLLYPYPRDAGLGEARTLLVECRGRDGAWLPMDFLDRPPSGARWTVPLDRGDTLTIRTVYRQHLRAPRARYIVTTTRSWDRPLAQARFEIRLPVGATPVRFSHPFVPVPGPEETVYVYEAQDFWPDRDITVTWTDR